MELKEKLDIFKNKGFTYNPETGDVISHKGYIINGKSNKRKICSCRYFGKKIDIYCHQLAWYLYYEEIPLGDIDHINRNASDNRIVNLRLISHQHNAFNTNAKGYCWRESLKKYQAYINIDGIFINLGHYLNEEDARQAYLNAKEKYHIILNIKGLKITP